MRLSFASLQRIQDLTQRLIIVAILVSAAKDFAAFGKEKSVASDPAKIEFFEKRIRPLLVKNCYNCHSADNGGKGELRVDDRNGLIEGGGRGPGIVPGRPEESLLLKAVRHQGGLEMPPKTKLTDEEIFDLENWILDGAVWPPVEVPEDIAEPKPEYSRLRKEHWAWQPLVDAQPPQVSNDSFVFNDIDRFLLAKLNEKGLTPSRDAEKLTLIRRVTFDLVGLPPTLNEIASFFKDQSPDAFVKVVDRLLNSPAFGERWARHWLDVARYGESTGSARNLPLPHAWRYRDYVIDSFTCDKPYNEFVREQIAGDLLPANNPGEKARQLIATGFLALGVKDVNQRFKVRFTMDNIDEQIDTMSRSILALTASCARCHDHKFDPIPTVDYYALAGIFHSTELCAGVRSKMGGGGFDYYDTEKLLHVGMGPTLDQETAQKIEQQAKAVATARAELEAIRVTPEGKVIENGQSKEQIAQQKLNKAERELFILKDPARYEPLAYGVRECKFIGDTEVRIRGEAEKLGPTIPRGFLGVISISDPVRVNQSQSGRLELAHWLTSEQNPLTQRVIVNRIWQHLFQQGIVTSVDNFGVTGDLPSHPELLDYLAKQFARGGWSIKKLVRMIVLSHSYQLSAESSPDNFTVDPANRMVWRHSARRLDAEEIRDAMLATSGRLDLNRPEGSPAKSLYVVEIQNNGKEASHLQNESLLSIHRSIYLPLVRGVTPRSLEVFDFAEQGLVTGSRNSTTVPTQALYLLNDPFVRHQSLIFAERLLQNAETNDDERIVLAYQLAFGHAPNTDQVDRAKRFLEECETASRHELAASITVNSENAVVADRSDTSPPQLTTSTGTSVVTHQSTGLSKDEEVLALKNPRIIAWSSFCQALFGSAEFRYIE